MKCYRRGKVHVQSRMCGTCIFRSGNLMHLDDGRVERMVDDATSVDGVIVCHDTIGDTRGGRVCRGFYDKHKTPPLRLAELMGRVVESEPRSSQKGQNENQGTERGD